jgi:hypothetical protein
MDALPHGMFETLNGIKVSGELSYHLNFFMRDSFPSDNVFDAELRKYNFQILQYGETNLAKLNGAFNYTPYEYGRPMRTFEVGPGNAHFTPFEQISPYLRYACCALKIPRFFTPWFCDGSHSAIHCHQLCTPQIQTRGQHHQHAVGEKHFPNT